MTWTLPPPQRGLLQTSESTIRRTIQQVVNGSFDAHLIWNFTLSGEILDRVIFQIGVVRSGKKTSSGIVSIDPTLNYHGLCSLIKWLETVSGFQYFQRLIF